MGFKGLFISGGAPPKSKGEASDEMDAILRSVGVDPKNSTNPTSPGQPVRLAPLGTGIQVSAAPVPLLDPLAADLQHVYEQAGITPEEQQLVNTVSKLVSDLAALPPEVKRTAVEASMKAVGIDKIRATNVWGRQQRAIDGWIQLGQRHTASKQSDQNNTIQRLQRQIADAQTVLSSLQQTQERFESSFATHRSNIANFLSFFS